MSEIVLRRNKDAIKMQVVTVGFMMVLTGVIVSFLFGIINIFSARIVTVILVLFWIISVVTWLVWGLLSYKNFAGLTYWLGDHSVIIEKRTVFGKERNLYRYDLIQGVTTRINYLGVKHSFGSIILDIPTSEKEIVLTNVEEADAVAASIKNKAVSMSSSVKVSVNN